MLLDHIGHLFGVSRERARQLVKQGCEEERRILSGDPWYELTARTRNALTNDGCEPTPAGAAMYLATRDWKRTVAFGIKSHAELLAWLERHKESSDEDPAPSDTIIYRPDC